MAVFLSPVGGAGAQFFDNSGYPLTGGKLYTYAAGTTTLQTTYTTSAGNVAHTNPIVLDSAGRVPTGEIWLTFAAYKFVLHTSADVLIATYDNIRGNGASEQIPENFTGTGSQTVFTLAAAPYSENSTNVYINGVYQQKNTYSIAGAVITFSEAPPVNSSIEVNYV
jgi:Domain of unknown function (DUF4183)